ncbi:signal peptidase I [Clostridium botulinum 202F]|nr:signal peptidase I [Clostridium botulinum 202F]KAI3345748.1 signal peptidase I [Clostridium botulinum]
MLEFFYLIFTSTTRKTYKVELIIGIVLTLLLSKFILSNIFYIALVPSISMKNTLMVGYNLIITKNIDTLKVGEIYTFHHNDKLLIKRLIAKGRDHVTIENDDVFINGKKLDEPYVSSSMAKEIVIAEITKVCDGYGNYLCDKCCSENDCLADMQI